MQEFDPPKGYPRCQFLETQSHSTVPAKSFWLNQSTKWPISCSFWSSITFNSFIKKMKKKNIFHRSAIWAREQSPAQACDQSNFSITFHKYLDYIIHCALIKLYCCRCFRNRKKNAKKTQMQPTDKHLILFIHIGSCSSSTLLSLYFSVAWVVKYIDDHHSNPNIDNRDHLYG